MSSIDLLMESSDVIRTTGADSVSVSSILNIEWHVVCGQSSDSSNFTVPV